MISNKQLVGDNNHQPSLFGLAGWSGSGKTTLAEKIIKSIVNKGYTISSIKHAHHNFDADIEGKDSWRHRKAGSKQVIISSKNRTAYFVEHEKEVPPQLDDLLLKLNYTDFVLIEGFKKISIPKIEVSRIGIHKPFLFNNDNKIIAIASDGDVKNCSLPILNLNNSEEIVAFILNYFGYL